MAGLVLEGGSFRGVFSAGAMHALLEYELDFEYVVGVSAGIAYGVSYVSRQKERNLEIVRKYRNDPRYISKRNFLRCKSMFGLDFVFDEIPNKLIPFDWEVFRHSSTLVKVGITNAKTGQAEYKDGKTMDKQGTMLRASCAIPFYFPPITVDGKQYFDGGLADPIPIKKSIEDGNEKNLIILTQPQGFLKEQKKSEKVGAFLARRKYPGLANAMLERPKLYNDTIQYIEELAAEKPQDVVVLRPEHKLRSFEADPAVLEQSYRHGYDLVVDNVEVIKKLLR